MNLVAFRMHAAGLFLFGALGGAQAATFASDCPDPAGPGGCAIRMEGEIISGDADRLGEVLARRPTGGFYNSLYLNSNGGSVQAAIVLAGVVRRALLRTSTMRPLSTSQLEHYTCVSSCVLIWAAGVERFAVSVENGGQHYGIGLHRPYFTPSTYSTESPDRIAAMQSQAMKSVSEFLRGEQIPQDLIDKMISHASSQVYWPTSVESLKLAGRRPWFDEMMIARCSYDPAYEVQSMLWLEKLERTKGTRTLEQAGGARYQQYLQRTQTYSACEANVKRQAQTAFLKPDIQPPSPPPLAMRPAPMPRPNRGAAPPIPEFRDSDSRLAYLRWLGHESEILKGAIPDGDSRKEFLQTVWYEARRAGLDVSLVLAIVEQQSSFRKFAVNTVGGRGYMGVSPARMRAVGGEPQDLFHAQTNLRVGCATLLHFVELKHGNMSAALVDYYRESHGVSARDADIKGFPLRVFAAQRRFIFPEEGSVGASVKN